MSDPLADPFDSPTYRSVGSDIDSRTPHPGEAALLADAPQSGDIDPLSCPACDHAPFKNLAGRNSHMALAHAIPAEPREKVRTKSKDKAPPSVTVNIAGPKSTGKDPALDAVEERARQLAQIIAGLVMMAGQPADALDIQKGSEPWSKAVRELAVYEPWLKRLAAGGEESGRVMAWVAVIASTLGMTMPILLRHNVLPEKLASSFEAAMSIQEAAKHGAPQTAAAGV